MKTVLFSKWKRKSQTQISPRPNQQKPDLLFQESPQEPNENHPAQLNVKPPTNANLKSKTPNPKSQRGQQKPDLLFQGNLQEPNENHPYPIECQNAHKCQSKIQNPQSKIQNHWRLISHFNGAPTIPRAIEMTRRKTKSPKTTWVRNEMIGFTKPRKPVLLLCLSSWPNQMIPRRRPLNIPNTTDLSATHAERFFCCLPQLF